MNEKSIRMVPQNESGNGLNERDAPASIEMTLRITFSTLWTGLQRSDACSYMVGSSPGVCKIDMQTVPSG